MALISTGHPALIKSLLTDKVGDGTNYVQHAYGRRQRPWAAGYYARARAEAANTIWGVNHPGETSPRVIRLQGAGVANNATDTTFTYTIPVAAMAALAGAGQVGIPVDTAFTTNLLLNAQMLIYALQDRSNAVHVKRIATGTAVPAATDALAPFFKTLIAGSATVSGTVEIVFGGVTSGALYKDLPQGWVADLILPDLTTVQSLKVFAAAGEDVIKLTDFLAVAGGTSAAQTVALNRIFQ